MDSMHISFDIEHELGMSYDEKLYRAREYSSTIMTILMNEGADKIDPILCEIIKNSAIHGGDRWYCSIDFKVHENQNYELKILCADNGKGIINKNRVKMGCDNFGLGLKILTPKNFSGVTTMIRKNNDEIIDLGNHGTSIKYPISNPISNTGVVYYIEIKRPLKEKMSISIRRDPY